MRFQSQLQLVTGLVAGGVSPPAPVIQDGINGNQTQFTAVWLSSVGATSYLLDVATDAGFSSFVSGYNGLNVGNVTSSAVTGLTSDTDYYFRVRAVGPGGTSGYSGVKLVHTDQAVISGAASITFTLTAPLYYMEGYSNDQGGNTPTAFIRPVTAGTHTVPVGLYNFNPSIAYYSFSIGPLASLNDWNAGSPPSGAMYYMEYEEDDAPNPFNPIVWPPGTVLPSASFAAASAFLLGSGTVPACTALTNTNWKVSAVSLLAGLVYDGSGKQSVILTVGKNYQLLFLANDISATLGFGAPQTFTPPPYTSYYFSAVLGTNALSLTGIPNAAVTAQLFQLN